ncbi:MAG: sulfotransferase [Candidatus Binatia bacterium]
MRRPSNESPIEPLHRRIAAHGVTPLAVAGPYRSGTSLVAAVCHALGADVGALANRATPRNPIGSFEAPLLAERCRQMYTEPWLVESVNRTQRVTSLAAWLSMAMTAAGGAQIIGGKHPILCLLSDELLEAWGERTKFLFVRRPVDEAIASLRKTNWLPWRANPGSHEQAIERLAAARDRAIERLGARSLVIDYHEMLRRPESAVDRIARFLGTGSPAGVAQAIALIQPALYRTKIERTR